jgi:LmbE family N-acetylglucosaminyl deacetylase
MIFKNKKILVISAHPDDETIGCGGTLYLAQKMGCNIKVLFLGEGVSTRFPNKENSDKSKKAKKIRENESKKALSILNIKQYKFSDRLCTQFDKFPIIDLVREIEYEINQFKPQIIFTHCDNETNIDHVYAHNATMIACRPTEINQIESIFSFETLCSGNYYHRQKFNPNFYSDITKSYSQKLEAMKCYKNEIRKYPHPRSIKGLEINSRYRGMQSGLELAEAFRLERAINTNKLFK